MMASLLADVRPAWRSVRAMPMLSLVVVLSLGAGIGVNTVVFSWMQALVLQPLPGVEDASRFLLIETRAETGSRPGVSWREYGDLRERVTALPDLFAFRPSPFNVGDSSRSERTFGLLVSGNYFTGLGLQPVLGRALEAADAARAGGEPVVVISHDLWQARFAGADGVVGSLLRVNGRDLTIVGVLPDGFQGTVMGLQFDLWMPATLAPILSAGSRELEDRGQRGYYAMGVPAPGATRVQVQTQVDAAMRDLARLYPSSNTAIAGEVLPFWRATRGPQTFMVQGLALLQGLMLLLLLAVCGNTANLLLARATSRRREMGVRLAIGAGPWRIVRLMLIEDLLLALAGAGVGVGIAWWGTTALRALPLFTAFPVRFQTSIDGTTLGFAGLLAVGCALAFGAAPAAQLARVDPQLALRTGILSAPRSRMRNALMGVEVALALVVLIVAGLFYRSVRDTRDLDTGFRREGVLLGAYDVSARGLDDDGVRALTYGLLEAIARVPDVEAVAIASSVPLDIHGFPLRSFALEGRARPDGAPDRALSNVVTPGYFESMDITRTAGAGFAGLTDRTAPPQVVVNEEFVRRYLGGAEPLGRWLESRGQRYLIAGVVANSLYDSFGEAAAPFMYFSYRDRPSSQGEIHVRTRAGAETLVASAVRAAVRSVDDTLPLYNVRTLGDHIETSLFFRRIPERMFVVLGPLLLLLAAIGIYAVVGYTVAHRTAEIGTRLVLGATVHGVVGQIVGESLRVIALGAAVGWLAVYVVYIHLMPGGSRSPAVFVGIPALLLGVATIACWVPARRASRVDPLVALRHE